MFREGSEPDQVGEQDRYESPLSGRRTGMGRRRGRRRRGLRGRGAVQRRAALRADLSAWLKRVRSGQEIVVTDRGRPIARVIPASTDSRLDELIAAGIVTPAKAPRVPAATFRRTHSSGSISDLVIELRRDRIP